MTDNETHQYEIASKEDISVKLTNDFINSLTRKLTQELNKMKSWVNKSISDHCDYVNITYRQLSVRDIEENALMRSISALEACKKNVDIDLVQIKHYLEITKAIKNEMELLSMECWTNTNTVLKQYVDREITQSINKLKVELTNHKDEND